MNSTNDIRVLDQGWTVGPVEKNDLRIPAVVPSSIHYDLMAAEELANPFASNENATAAHWVSATAWRYEMEFPLAADETRAEWALEFDGIDTFGEVFVNGHSLGSSRNALRRVVKHIDASFLKEGANTLEVVVRGHNSGVEDSIDEARRRLRHKGEIEGLLGKSLLRRYQRSFFSMSSLLNLGTGVLGIGLNGTVRLRKLSSLKVDGLFVETTRIEQATARVRCLVDLEAPSGGDLSIRLTDPETQAVTTLTAAVPAGARVVEVEGLIQDAKLWWPVGYGEPNLYRADVRLDDEAGNSAELQSSVGIRTIELRQETETSRPTFQIIANGVPIWVRGTNYVPVDYLKIRGTAEQYARIFALLESGNNNMVRMWGGGATESEAWYGECDRRGILIWQDFYLHSNTYPDYDEAWVEEFRQEAEELIRRVRPHASLAIVCGGNEQREGWEEWHWRETLEGFFGESLVTEVIPEILSRIETGVPYVNNSPHGGLFSQSPVVGDAHVWGNHFNSTKDPLFVTETCWGQESYSRPETLSEVMDLDVDSFVGPDWMTRWTETTSLPVLLRFPYSGYHSVGGLRAYLKDLEIEQAMADYHSLSNFRLRSPSCRGVLYWSFNKGGPLFQFGAIDYQLRPMMSHYVAARLNRAVVVGAYRDISTVRIAVSNARAATVNARVEVQHLDARGNQLGFWESEVSVAPGAPRQVMNLEDMYESVVDRTTESVHVRLIEDDVVLSEDLLIFCPLVEFLPESPQLDHDIRQVAADEWLLTVSTQGVAKMVQIEGGDSIILDQNYFPLVPGRPTEVHIKALDGEAVPVELAISALDGGEPTLAGVQTAQY